MLVLTNLMTILRLNGAGMYAMLMQNFADACSYKHKLVLPGSYKDMNRSYYLGLGELPYM